MTCYNKAIPKATYATKTYGQLADTYFSGTNYQGQRQYPVQQVQSYVAGAPEVRPEIAHGGAADGADGIEKHLREPHTKTLDGTVAVFPVMYVCVPVIQVLVPAYAPEQDELKQLENFYRRQQNLQKKIAAKQYKTNEWATKTTSLARKA